MPDRSLLVSDLANMIEMNQPCITKIVIVLVEENLLESTVDANDKRKRYLKITQQVLSVCQNMIQSLLLDISFTFADWDN